MASGNMLFGNNSNTAGINNSVGEFTTLTSAVTSVAGQGTLTVENTLSTPGAPGQGHALVARSRGNGQGFGVLGESTLNSGVLGTSNQGNGVQGTSINRNGVQGESFFTDASGVYGENMSGGYGTAGRANGERPAVFGDNIGTGPGVVALAVGPNASGVHAESISWSGVSCTGGSYGLISVTAVETAGTGVYGRGGTGVHGRSYTGDGVWGDTDTGNGVKGQSSLNSNTAAGVYGLAQGTNSNGVIGEANNGPSAYGVWGKSTSGYAGFFNGTVHVNGTLTKASGGFLIDHPLDPQNRNLSHSFVESPDMLNVYSGAVTTDDDGNATVQLPNYFEALNRDFRYQLTVIGHLFTQAIVSEEITNNQFSIMTDRPNTTVSWQVTGVRSDAFATMKPVPVEEDKPADERGMYLYPEAYGRPPTEGAGYTREHALKDAQREVSDQEPTVPRFNPPSS